MANVSLSAGVRAALTSLSSTVNSAQESQLRLATGKKVNSAVDSPVNFFTAAGLNDRAGQLSGLLDGIGNGIQTIQAASKGIDSITKVVQSLQSTIKQAQNEAAANRPTISGTASLGATRDAALSKTFTDLAVAGTTLQIKAGKTTFQATVSGTTTIRDLVSTINSSGVATASVTDDGKLKIQGTGSDALSVEFGAMNTATPPAFVATAADADTIKVFGRVDPADNTSASVDTTSVAGGATSAVRSNLVKQYNDLRTQLDNLAKDSGYNGINLLGGDKLSLIFNEKTGDSKNKLDIQGDTVNSANLGIGTAVDGTASAGQFNIQNDADLAAASDSLINVLSSLRSTASSFGANLAVVQTRQDFTKSMIQTLNDGADNLTAADTNQEGAKLLALQTRQQLSQTALSLSNQADQAVLRLF